MKVKYVHPLYEGLQGFDDTNLSGNLIYEEGLGCEVSGMELEFQTRFLLVPVQGKLRYVRNPLDESKLQFSITNYF